MKFYFLILVFVCSQKSAHADSFCSGLFDDRAEFVSSINRDLELIVDIERTQSSSSAKMQEMSKHLLLVLWNNLVADAYDNGFDDQNIKELADLLQLKRNN